MEKEQNHTEDASNPNSTGSDDYNNNSNKNEPGLGKKSFDFASNFYSSFVDNVKLAWDDMTGKSKETALKRTVVQAETFRRAKSADDNTMNTDDEEEDSKPKYTGPSALVHVKDPISQWERMKYRLNDSPLIREILKGTKKVGDAAAATDIGKQATKVTQGVREKLEDAREFWETSQNPIVYTMSGVWENITGDTEEGLTIAEIRKYDPNFVKEEWAEEVRLHLSPSIVKAHLLGDLKSLRPLCGEAVYHKLAADIRARKEDGVTIDTNILAFDENAIVMKLLEDRGPVIVCVYMVQQINCIRNKEGEIKEGAENDIRAKFYSIAFQQTYEEEEGVVKWKVVDYEFQGDMPYL